MNIRPILVDLPAPGADGDAMADLVDRLHHRVDQRDQQQVLPDPSRPSISPARSRAPPLGPAAAPAPARPAPARASTRRPWQDRHRPAQVPQGPGRGRSAGRGSRAGFHHQLLPGLGPVLCPAVPADRRAAAGPDRRAGPRRALPGQKVDDGLLRRRPPLPARPRPAPQDFRQGWAAVHPAQDAVACRRDACGPCLEGWHRLRTYQVSPR